MHIQDNLVPGALWVGGYAVAGVATGLVLTRLRDEDIPRTAIMTSLFFAVSSIHIPLPAGSVHLVLNGLMGVVLGWLAVPAILIGLGFQLLLFGFGGVTTLGLNTVTLAAGALAARGIFAARRIAARSRRREIIAGAAAGAAGALASALLYFLALSSSGEELRNAARIAFVFQAPVVAIEAAVTAFAVSFLATVKPELLDGRPT